MSLIRKMLDVIYADVKDDLGTIRVTYLWWKMMYVMICMMCDSIMQNELVNVLIGSNAF